MSKEHPILFSTLMVQAILEGRKTQTRRIVKPQPTVDVDSGRVFVEGRSPYDIHNWKEPFIDSYARWKVGDTLWVRETWNTLEEFSEKPDYSVMGKDEFIYKADNNRIDKWKPSIFMPKEACRIKLKIVNISVQKLHEVDELDSIKEGVLSISHDWVLNNFPEYAKDYKEWETIDNLSKPPIGPAPSERYKALWKKINGKESWDLNPWVWVIEFKKLQS